MNILIISHFYPPHFGGVEVAAEQIAITLSQKLSQKVVILTSKVSGAMKSFEEKKNLHIYRFKSFTPTFLKKLIPQISSFGLMIGAFFKLKKIIRNHQIDTIHILGRFWPVSILSFIQNALFFKRRIFLHIQARLLFGLSGKIENIFDKIITSTLYSKANKIITVSSSLENRLKSFGICDKKLVTIPNGVEYETFANESENEFLHQKIRLSKNDKIVLFVGRFEKQKGLKYLIRAMPKVLDIFPYVKLVIIGNGSLRRSIIAEIEKQGIISSTYILDFFPHSSMAKIFRSADVFCLPSIHEGFPLSIAEALAVGIPIVASKTEGIPEAIKESVNGFLVKPKNSLDLSQKLISALCLTKEERKLMKKNNQTKAKNYYSWNVITQKIFHIFQSLNPNKC